MSRHALITATTLLFATSAAHALSTGLGVSVQVPGVSVQTQADAKVSTPAVDLKASQAAAVKSAQSAKDASINAGLNAAATGQSAAASASAAAQAGAASAKAQGQATAEAAKAQAQAKLDAKLGLGQQGLAKGHAIAAGYQQKAADRIALKDRVALGKHFGAIKATGKAVTGLLGAIGGKSAAQGNAQTSALPAGYENKLVIGAKLDAKLAGQATVIDAKAISGLSVQPKGTELLQVGNRAVRVDSKTRVVLDVATI